MEWKKAIFLGIIIITVLIAGCSSGLRGGGSTMVRLVGTVYIESWENVLTTVNGAAIYVTGTIDEENIVVHGTTNIDGEYSITFNMTALTGTVTVRADYGPRTASEDVIVYLGETALVPDLVLEMSE